MKPFNECFEYSIEDSEVTTFSPVNETPTRVLHSDETFCRILLQVGEIHGEQSGSLNCATDYGYF